MKTKKKIKIKMSVEFEVVTPERPYAEDEEWLNMVAKNYVECLGDKNIKIEYADFV